jgi:ABC-type nitrate/sulfonate/bicarbonate transport system permease component
MMIDADPRKMFGLRIGVLLTLGLVWQLAAWRIANPTLLPGIDHIFRSSLPSLAIFSGYSEGSFVGGVYTLLIHTYYTLIRVVISLTCGSVVGLITGMSMHYFRRSQRGYALLLAIIRAVPLFSLIPLFLYWFGGGEIGIYLYICFSVFIVIATNTYEAVLNVPPAYIHHASLLGATRFQIFKTVVVFAIQPQLIGGLRNVIGLCWAFSLGAEYLSAHTGIGYLLYQSYLYSDMGKIVVIAALYAILGMLSFIFTGRLLATLRRWD